MPGSMGQAAGELRPAVSSWRQPGMPDGPVYLVIIVFTGDGELMGSAPVTRQPRWQWKDGALAISYSPVRVVLARGGTYSTALICAVSADTGVYVPLWPVSLGDPQQMRAGDDIHITDGVISIIPDLPGPHG
jgi:hypothetical protein